MLAFTLSSNSEFIFPNPFPNIVLIIPSSCSRPIMPEINLSSHFELIPWAYFMSERERFSKRGFDFLPSTGLHIYPPTFYFNLICSICFMINKKNDGRMRHVTFPIKFNSNQIYLGNYIHESLEKASLNVQVSSLFLKSWCAFLNSWRLGKWLLFEFMP